MPQLPGVLKTVIELCPHGVLLRSGDEVLYANAAWTHLRDGTVASKEGQNPSGRELHEASFALTFENRPVEISVIQDISARTRLEAQLQEAQRLESLGRWVGSIVHDFRNVLTAVMLYSDLLAQITEPGSIGAKYNSEVKEAVKRGTDLIGQLLSFARQRTPEVKDLSLNSLLSGVRDVLRRMTGEDVELVFDLCDSPCRVHVDATQMQQVIFNLVVNARQAMPEGGRITIRTRQLTGTANHGQGAVAAGTVELVVSDDGVGMDSATLSHAFEPFFTTKPKGKGTGLGLPTVQSIVTQYGGSVCIDSKPAEGTTITILLPLAESERIEVGCETAGDVPCGSETVLLVEDDSAVRTPMREMLSQLGYTVIEASAGLDAIRAAEQHEGPINLLIADMVLPGLSGREIARRIKMDRPEVRVLFISGYEADGVSQLPDLFSKPFTKQALARKVREVLDCSEPGFSRAHSTYI